MVGAALRLFVNGVGVGALVVFLVGNDSVIPTLIPVVHG